MGTGYFDHGKKKQEMESYLLYLGVSESNISRIISLTNFNAQLFIH